MFILACGGASYARLRFNIGPGGDLVIPSEIDYLRPFAASDVVAWKQEYLDNVCELQAAPSRRRRLRLDQEFVQLGDDELLASLSFNPEHWFYDC